MKGAKGERSNVKSKRKLKANPGVLTLAFYCPKQVVIPRRRYLGFGPWEKKQILLRLHEFLAESWDATGA